MGARIERRLSDKSPVQEYDFTLKYVLTSTHTDLDDVVERLATAGCDDALVGIGIHGRLSLNFIRAGASAEEAVLSALSDVRDAIPEAQLVEAAPDFVGLTDVAALLAVSRQNMRKLIVECDAESPAPIHQGKASIWRLARVLEWLRDVREYPVDDSLVALAETTMQVNLAVDVPRLDEDFQRNVRALLA